MAPSVVSMSTLYVLSLRTEEDLVETDGYVPGGLAAAPGPARWGFGGQPRVRGAVEPVSSKGGSASGSQPAGSRWGRGGKRCLEQE